jgi:predicted amidophosphoribosyltransferase
MPSGAPTPTDRPDRVASVAADAAHAARVWLAVATAALAPPSCIACRRPLARAGGAGGPLCPACRAVLPWLRGERCPRCALPSPCGSRCAMAGSAIARTWAPLAFEGPARDVVHALKFRGALGLADLMAAQIVATAPSDLLRTGACLVPVPTPAGRRRRRGFDHAARLADAIAARTGLAVAPCLRRRGPAPRQARAGRAARLEGGRVLLEIAGTVPERAILVDDVHTTGATLRACGRRLQMNGALAVCGVTYARALR